MLKQNSELRAQARESLQGKWLMAAVAALIYCFVIGALSAVPYVGRLASLFVGLPLAYGLAILMFGVLKGKQVDIEVLFEGFHDYARILVTKLLQQIYTALWTMLLIVPGVMKYYSYAMTDYILKEEPEMKNNAAIEKSMAMMENNRMKLFTLDLSFIGWFFLSILTLGIGLFFLLPYVHTAHAAFYEDLKAQQGANAEASAAV
ncbi:DUF975 family protein [uncultured Bacteroides sp.]|uniref:DUF975 family protein n=1 Tax=uncultured Bacteroides sp. TaxID=162156 RepID=UPI0025F8D5F3|nr:DUF975 family protein [uncultured Bacteroides sp.]